MVWRRAGDKPLSEPTRTTRAPAFWGYPPPPPPPPPHDYPYYWVILDPKSIEDKVKVTNLKNLPNFSIMKQTLQAAHLPKLLEKMCIYEMHTMSIVEFTEQTRFCPQTDGRIDGQMDRRTRWNQYTPLSTSLKRGYNDGMTSNADSAELSQEVPNISAKHIQSPEIVCGYLYLWLIDDQFWTLVH